MDDEELLRVTVEEAAGFSNAALVSLKNFVDVWDFIVFFVLNYNIVRVYHNWFSKKNMDINELCINKLMQVGK